MSGPEPDWEDVKKKRAALVEADNAARRAAVEEVEARKRSNEARELANNAQKEFNEALWPEWAKVAE